MAIYYKKANVRVYSNNFTLVSDEGLRPISVQQVGLTTEQLNYSWSTIARNKTPSEILDIMGQFMSPMLFPYFSPGRYSGQLVNLTDYPTFARYDVGDVIPKSITEGSTNFYFSYVNDNGDGMYSTLSIGAIRPFYRELSVNYEFDSHSNAPWGVSGNGWGSGSTDGNFMFCIISSDGDVHFYKLYADRNNSVHGVMTGNGASKFIAWLTTLPDYDPWDPYQDVPITIPEPPGEQEYSEDEDDTPTPTLPTVSMSDTGFTRIYNPTEAQLRDLARYLWTDQTLLTTLWNHVKQFLENPMDAFIALNMVPCAVPDGGTVNFRVMFFNTDKYLTKAATQFVTVDCGTVNVPRMYNSALDYSPYSRISLFLPFIGTQPLDIDDVMGKTISLKYNIDIASGGCVALVSVDGNVHYQYSGHCALTLPFTSSDFSNYVSAIIGTGKAIAGVVAGAAGDAAGAATLLGARAPRQATGDSMTSTDFANYDSSGNVSMTRHTETVRQGKHATKASFGSLAVQGFANTVGAVMGGKLMVEHSGSFSGITGYLGCRYPFIILESPRLANPEKYGKFNGRPCLYYEQLGNLSGYTVVQEVQLTGIYATNPELDEIGEFLKGGVIL